MERITLERSGSHLALVDFGGNGQPVLLLHGLAGHAEEWAETAGWLLETHHTFALDLRGHGLSERNPEDVSLEALVHDVSAVIDRMGGPIVLVGHSVGGVIAIAVTATRPDLVGRLVVSDAGPSGDPVSAEATAGEIREALSRWPVPFRTRNDAIEFFGGPSLASAAWVDGLEERSDGLWPRFDIDVMSRILQEVTRESQWAAWERISCPILVVRAGQGLLDKKEAEQMIKRQPRGRLVEVPGAKHDVHLDRPEEWRKALSEFTDHPT